MNSTLVCIAKNEDHYIDEWIDYHMKLGFSQVFVYQNNWRYSGKKLIQDSIHWIPFDGELMQMKAYNDFIDMKSSGTDFAAFIDVDEYICLKEPIGISNFFQQFIDYYGVALNWKLFGDSGIADVVGDDYSLVNRFTHCQVGFNKHVKTILNMRMCGTRFHFINPHYVDAALHYDITVCVDKSHYVKGPFNETTASSMPAWINHYHTKTYGEFKRVKSARGRADTLVSHPLYNYNDQIFVDHNKNETKDFTARDFFNSRATIV